MASGLVEPFISHLKFAKEQISKGGYSISIPPPFPRASWFTKNTFQRFVRFVSTPELLERSVRIEQEILQIESSVQSNELPKTNITGNDGALEEPSKIHLQQVLEARKALLQKEQAMAYASAIVAGFEMDSVDNLVCFADAFGASRLREACEDFKELYKKKYTDCQWIEELAAMKASSLQNSSNMGISAATVACENNGSSFQRNGVAVGSAVSNGSSDPPSELIVTPPNPDRKGDNNTAGSIQMPLTSGEVKFQVPWTNQMPQYMYLHGNQQIPHYLGYPLPNVHPLPPFYPGHAFWPQNKHANGNDQGFNNDQFHKSAQKKEKLSYASGPEPLKIDEQTETSDSDTGDEVDAVKSHDGKYYSRKKRHLKKKNKSSKTVVIRNINYITSNRRNGNKNGISEDSSSAENVSLDEVSSRREVDEAVASFDIHANSKESNCQNSSHQGLYNENGTNGYTDHGLTYDLAGKIGNGMEKNENWSALQSLLRSHEESNSNGIQHENFQDEHLVIHKSDNEVSLKASSYGDWGSEKERKQNLTTDDSILMTRTNVGGDGALDSVDFKSGETLCTSMKKREYEDMPLIAKNIEESGRNYFSAPSEFASQAIIRNTSDEDCFVVNHAGFLESEAKQIIFESFDTTSIRGDSCLRETSKSAAASVDDSFMVQSRTEVDDQYDSEWRTDISTVVDWTLGQNENGDANVADSKLEISRIYEPDDLSVILARDDQPVPVGASWTPEMDFGMDMSIAEVDKSSGAIHPKSPTQAKLPVNHKSTNAKTNATPTLRASIIDAKSKVVQGSPAKTKKTHPTSRLDIRKSKLAKEEEVRKRMEQLVIERQKRIAERTAAVGLNPAASKRVPAGCKPVASKAEKHSPHQLLADKKL